jgi:hypothetical protein
MKTLSEYESDSGVYRAKVLWYPKRKCWIMRGEAQGKTQVEQLCNTEFDAETKAEDWVLQDREAEDTEDTGETE